MKAGLAVLMTYFFCKTRGMVRFLGYSAGVALFLSSMAFASDDLGTSENPSVDARLNMPPIADGAAATLTALPGSQTQDHAALPLPPDDGQKSQTSCNEPEKTKLSESHLGKNIILEKISEIRRDIRQIMTCSSEFNEKQKYSELEMARFNILLSIFDMKLTPDGKAVVSSENSAALFKEYAIIKNDILKYLINLFDELEQNKNISSDQISDETIEAFFNNQNITLTSEEKVGIYATLLPYLLARARVSSSASKVRNLLEVKRTVRRDGIFGQMEVVCRVRYEDGVYRMAFPFDVFFMKKAAIQMDLGSEPNPAREDHCESGGIYCEGRFSQSLGSAPAGLDEILDMALFSLLAKDNTAIDESLEALCLALERRRLSRGFGMSVALPCELQTIVLLGMEQHRFAMLQRLERDILELYPQASFGVRLAGYEACGASLSGEMRLVYDRLWAENGEAYRWVNHHFTAKRMKSLDKAVAVWTKPTRRDDRLTRRVLASWTALQMGDVQRALKFAGNLTKGRSALVHPQLNAYAWMLELAGVDAPVAWDRLESFVRTAFLKTPPLAYQMFSAVAAWMDRAKRRSIVGMMRRYSPMLSPWAAAQFYVAYEDEFRRQLDAGQQIPIEVWLDGERARGEDLCAMERRRMAAFDRLVDLGSPEAAGFILERALREPLSAAHKKAWTDRRQRLYEAQSVRSVGQPGV